MTLAFKDDLRWLFSGPLVGARAQRAFGICAGAILLGIMAYIAAAYGFDAVATCKVNTYRVLGYGRSLTSQIALSSACGF